MTDTFAFTVTISAAEWSELQRRLRFVEAALIQTLRGERRLKEWFSAAELADLALPGIPATKQGLLKRAHAEQWRSRRIYGAGGERFEFHFAALPRHAFEALLDRGHHPRFGGRGFPAFSGAIHPAPRIAGSPAGAGRQRHPALAPSASADHPEWRSG